MTENIVTDEKSGHQLAKDEFFINEVDTILKSKKNPNFNELEMGNQQSNVIQNGNSNSKSPRLKDINDSQTILIEKTPPHNKNESNITDLQKVDSDNFKTSKPHLSNIKILSELDDEKRSGEGTPDRVIEKKRSILSTTSPVKRRTKTSEDENEIDVFKDTKEVKKNPTIEILDKILNSRVMQTLVNVFTIYALFGDDIKVACLPKSSDLGFNILNIMALLIFTVEILISCKTRKEYFLSFFFWLDVLSTLSLVLDLTWVNTQLFGNSISSAASLARAGRASRVGTKAGRVVRLVRLVRLVKVYKQTREKEKISSKVAPLGKKKKNKKDAKKGDPALDVNQQSLSQVSIEDEEIQVDPQKESRVGKRLSELTTKRVIVIVLSLILFVPMFQADLFFDFDKGFTMGIIIIQNFSEENFPLNAVNQQYVNQGWAQYKSLFEVEVYPLTFAVVPSIKPTVYGRTDFLDYLREDEYEMYQTWSEKYKENFISVIDVRHKTQANAIINICRTIYVSIVLTVGALMFSKDANELALRPIERMIEKVNRIARNPLASRYEGFVKEGGKEQMETTIIENAIIKIGTLLALGFGDAGSEIIAVNMAKGGDVDPMLPGKKKYAIFGFCDIRNFTDATEILQEDVMLFVNSIGEIVHKTVDYYAGSANKNIGDAFLLVWKFPEDEIIIEEDGKCELNRTRVVKNVADLSLISFLKIIARINRVPKILDYRKNPKLCERMPGYKVKMGFGLHIGWAIEGAIGSEFKIDASYLSPNVNMASRLEAATKQYGVPLLISNELHRYFSKETRSYCREIDRVTVKGSKKPIGLFTCDTDVSELLPSKTRTESKNDISEKHSKKKQAFLETVFNQGGKKTSDLFAEDKDLKLLMKRCKGPLLDKWREAFSTYIEGNWKETKSLLEACLAISPDDGPTGALLGVIKDSNYTAPSDWKGYRELTEK